MKNRPAAAQKALLPLTSKICSDRELIARDIEKHFKHRRKLCPERLIKHLFGMGGGSLDSEFLDHFGCSASTASAPALIQQRTNLRPEAMERPFQDFQFKPRSLYHSFRLLAMDEFDMQVDLDLPHKKLYAMRWGVETLFRELKYTVGLLYFHSKKAGSSSRRSGHG